MDTYSVWRVVTSFKKIRTRRLSRETSGKPCKSSQDCRNCLNSDGKNGCSVWKGVEIAIDVELNESVLCRTPNKEMLSENEPFYGKLRVVFYFHQDLHINGACHLRERRENSPWIQNTINKWCFKGRPALCVCRLCLLFTRFLRLLWLRLDDINSKTFSALRSVRVSTNDKMYN